MLSSLQLLTSAGANILQIESYAHFNAFTLLPLLGEPRLDDLYVDRWSSFDDLSLERSFALSRIVDANAQQHSFVENTLEQQQSNSEASPTVAAQIIEFPDDDYCPMHGRNGKTCIFYKWDQKKDPSPQDEANSEAASKPRSVGALKQVDVLKPALLRTQPQSSSPLKAPLAHRPCDGQNEDFGAASEGKSFWPKIAQTFQHVLVDDILLRTFSLRSMY